MEKSLLPASSTQIMKELTKLRLHFPGISMSEEEVTILMHDYISDMANYPIDIIESACREYIRDENSQYFPKLGRILSLMNKSWYRRKWKLKKLNILLSVSNNYKEFDNVQSK